MTAPHATLLQRIAQVWFAALPPHGWEQCELFWAQVGEQTFCQAELLSQERRQHFPFPAALHPLLAELRGAMAGPDGGYWLSTRGLASAGGTVEFFHNWDRRYYFNGLPGVFDPPQAEAPFPSEADFLAELDLHPRAAPFWPGWLVPQGVQVPVFESPTLPPSALAWVTHPDTYGWPAMYGQLDECLRGQLRMMPQSSPALLGWQGEAARRAALQELLDLVLACALKTLRRSDAEVTARMGQAWATRTGQPASDDPLSDVQRVLRVLAAQMIAARFDTVAPQ